MRLGEVSDMNDKLQSRQAADIAVTGVSE